jgi:deazaflavin-dependent oxidoreductase (nitroreductase family)
MARTVSSGVWKNATGRGVVGDMSLTGTYVPSKAEWVRNQVAEYEASDGERANTLPDTSFPIVVITSVGAKSGNLRKNPVMRVERDGAYLAVASKGGAPENPEWYYNFVAHPEVELQDGAEKHVYTARILEGEERADWWEHAVATWSTYASYQEKTDREIPLFLLERA